MKQWNLGELLSAKLYVTRRTWRVSIHCGESRCPNSTAVSVVSAKRGFGWYDHTAADIGRVIVGGGMGKSDGHLAAKPNAQWTSRYTWRKIERTLHETASVGTASTEAALGAAKPSERNAKRLEYPRVRPPVEYWRKLSL
jgi:hypothetical protein